MEKGDKCLFFIFAADRQFGVRVEYRQFSYSGRKSDSTTGCLFNTIPVRMLSFSATRPKVYRFGFIDKMH